MVSGKARQMFSIIKRCSRALGATKGSNSSGSIVSVGGSICSGGGKSNANALGATST